MSFIKNFCLVIVIPAICILGVFGIYNIELSENLDAAIPGGGDFEKLSPWLESNKKSVVFALDIADIEDLDQAAARGEAFIELVNQKSPDAFSSMSYQSDTDPEEIADFFYDNLYLYLNPADYDEIDNLLTEEKISQKIRSNKSKLLSPESFGTKRWLIKDPLGFMGIVLKNVNQIEFSQEKINSQGLFLSHDHDRLFIRGQITHNPSKSAENTRLRKQLDELKTELEYPVDYFGVFLISDANSSQIKKDIRLTVSLALLLIVGLLIYYYRSGTILSLFLMPGIFGVLFAIGIIYLYHGQISGLALASGSIIFGIVADYSFHFFAQFRTSKNALETRNAILFPLGVSSLTTIAAFLSLTFAESKVLQDFGLFTSLSLLGTGLFVLGILPLLLRRVESTLKFSGPNPVDSFFDKIEIQDKQLSVWKLVLFFITTGILFYNALDIQFESDLSKLHYYPEELKARERSLQDIDPDTEGRLNILVGDSNLDTSILRNYHLYQKLEQQKDLGLVQESLGLGMLLIPKEVQTQKVARWNEYWNAKRLNTIANIKEASNENGFREEAFSDFYNLIGEQILSDEQIEFVKNDKIFSDLHLEYDGQFNLITSIVCKKNEIENIKTQLSSIPGITFLDGQSFVANLIEAVRRDFNFLLLFASGLVFLALLILYGSIELTLISFIPMVVSWIWILGVASILDIKFNFINIILATFIFGLGDDFSIFITDGLQKKYKYGTRVLKHYKSGIILSSISTIIGTGILIFTEHPALRSIALVSVLGIITIVFISFFLQPFLFRFFITSRTELGKPPRSLLRVLSSIIGYTIFILGSLLSVFVAFLVRVMPFLSISRKKEISHLIIQKASAIQMDLIPMIRKRYRGLENLNFEKPSIIIANHTSFLDVLMIVRLHPKIVILVKEWVYYSPLFGPLVRFADYVPSFESIDDNYSSLLKLKEKGYSLLVFPEGKRSENGKMRRFKKGAFHLSSKLEMDVTPIMLHGIHYAMSKYEYTVKNGFAEVAVLPRIKWNDASFGTNDKERTKRIAAHFKNEYKRHFFQADMVDHVYDPLLNIYKYKGPILEWYFRVKWKFEKYNYELYSQLIGPGEKKIYDLGCGYGYLSYFLYLRDDRRRVLGYDYDEEKVSVAKHAYLKNEQHSFDAIDIVNVKPAQADAIVLADVLHYLGKSEQIAVLNHAKEGLLHDGVIIIRDGIASSGEEHEWTKKSEKWSTSILSFNKTKGPLNFLKNGFLEEWSAKNGFICRLESSSNKSSNKVYSLRAERSY